MTQKSSNSVTLEAAKKANTKAPEPDRKATDEEKTFAHEENMQNAQLGWIGKKWVKYEAIY